LKNKNFLQKKLKIIYADEENTRIVKNLSLIQYNQYETDKKAKKIYEERQNNKMKELNNYPNNMVIQNFTVMPNDCNCSNYLDNNCLSDNTNAGKDKEDFYLFNKRLNYLNNTTGKNTNRYESPFSLIDNSSKNIKSILGNSLLNHTKCNHKEAIQNHFNKENKIEGFNSNINANYGKIKRVRIAKSFHNLKKNYKLNPSIDYSKSTSKLTSSITEVKSICKSEFIDGKNLKTNRLYGNEKRKIIGINSQNNKEQKKTELIKNLVLDTNRKNLVLNTNRKSSETRFLFNMSKIEKDDFENPKINEKKNESQNKNLNIDKKFDYFNNIISPQATESPPLNKIMLKSKIFKKEEDNNYDNRLEFQRKTVNNKEKFNIFLTKLNNNHNKNQDYLNCEKSKDVNSSKIKNFALPLSPNNNFQNKYLMEQVKSNYIDEFLVNNTNVDSNYISPKKSNSQLKLPNKNIDYFTNFKSQNIGSKDYINTKLSFNSEKKLTKPIIRTCSDLNLANEFKFTLNNFKNKSKKSFYRFNSGNFNLPLLSTLDLN